MKCNKQSYFLIVSGGRCGSTWLTASLSDIAALTADYEMRWRLDPRQKTALSLELLEHESIVDCLGKIGASTAFVGSKLTLPTNPRVRLTIEDVNALTEKFSQFQGRLVHLSRDYFDVLKSAMRGGFNLRSVDNSSVSLVAHLPTHEEREHKPIQLSGNEHQTIPILINQLKNDALIATLIKSSPSEAMTLSYEKIDVHLGEVVEFLSGGVLKLDDAGRQRILAQPKTKKLDKVLLLDDIQTIAGVEALSRRFQSVRDQLWKGETTFSELFDYVEARKEYRLKPNVLSRLLAQYDSLSTE